MVELSLFGPSLCTSYLGYVHAYTPFLPPCTFRGRSVGRSVRLTTPSHRYQPRFRQGDGGTQGSSGRVGSILAGQLEEKELQVFPSSQLLRLLPALHGRPAPPPHQASKTEARIGKDAALHAGNRPTFRGQLPITIQ